MGGQQLEDGRTLSDYGINHGGIVLTLVLRLRGNGHAAIPSETAAAAPAPRATPPQSLLFANVFDLDEAQAGGRVVRVADTVGTIPFLQEGDTITLARPSLGPPTVWAVLTQLEEPDATFMYPSEEDQDACPLSTSARKPEVRVRETVVTDWLPVSSVDVTLDIKASAPAEPATPPADVPRHPPKSAGPRPAPTPAQQNDAHTGDKPTERDLNASQSDELPTVGLDFEPYQTADEVLLYLLLQVASKLPPAMVARGFDVYLVRPSGAEVLVDGIGPLLSPLNCQRALVVREVPHGARPAVVFDADDDTTTESSSGDEALRFSNGHADEY